WRLFKHPTAKARVLQALRAPTEAARLGTLNNRASSQGAPIGTAPNVNKKGSACCSARLWFKIRLAVASFPTATKVLMPLLKHSRMSVGILESLESRIFLPENPAGWQAHPAYQETACVFDTPIHQ
ncbi:MAG: hypothetical protein U1C18_00520, partial [Patescibacteria group bacterium]|nr:hypothetical protein [Patescibacteria group bacterium]